MAFLHIMASIWNHLVGIFGTIFIVTALLSWLISLSQRNLVRGKKAVSKKADVPNAGVGTRRRVAIITGASSGLGRGYALALDKDPEKYDVSEVWLIARREDRLQALAEQLTLPTKVIPMDVTKKEDVEAFTGMLIRENREAALTVTLLLNCAGYGRYGTSTELGHEEENRMIRLNDEAAITMTDICVSYMRQGARIGEICSVAAFQPIPGFNAYAASKAFLYSYSRGRRQELMRKGISLTAVCPYWVKDTEFISTAAKGAEHKVPFASRTNSVVRLSLNAIRKYHAVSTPGIIPTLDRIFAGLIPDGIMAWIARKCL